MRLTISTRVSIFCAVVIVMALVLLAIGLSVGNKIHEADTSIAAMSEALRIEDEHDQAQRRLRLDVGDTTRQAERGVVIPDHRWEQLWKQADAFQRLASTPLRVSQSDPSFRWGWIREAREAASNFAQSSKNLIGLLVKIPASSAARCRNSSRL